MILIFDNFDSFTYNLVDYFRQGGASVEVLTNDLAPESIDINRYKGIVISPGPGTPENAGYTMALIEKSAGKIPILGICLGHQAIGSFYGAKIKPAIRPVHGKISRIHCLSEGVFRGLPDHMNVVRYHSLVCTQVPDCLQITAETDEGEVMAFRHKLQDLEGLQFHPEALLTEHGLQMLYNWMNCYKMQGG
ncbi:MAG: aminodeoxychorismate/anthranilate synthase component II [Cyclobacteriaceae bacterium]|nr:aminodeoxychorismate/anthranilate synthase component II [Cyclobacteriaceae bacterium]